MGDYKSIGEKGFIVTKKDGEYIFGVSNPDTMEIIKVHYTKVNIYTIVGCLRYYGDIGVNKECSRCSTCDNNGYIKLKETSSKVFKGDLVIDYIAATCPLRIIPENKSDKEYIRKLSELITIPDGCKYNQNMNGDVR